MARVAITDGNKSPLIEIFIWYFLVTAILTVLIRLIIKRFVLHRFNLDDLLIFISLLFASLQSIVLSVATANGFGQHLESLTSSQIASQFKAQYAANLLNIASYCFAKLSLVAFLRALTPEKSDRRICLILGSVIVTWAITSILPAAFQCHLPRPWNSLHNSCLDRLSLANYTVVMNILTDAGLIFLPIRIVTRLQVANEKRIVLSLVFFGRASVMVALVCQLVYLNQTTIPNDPSFDPWPAALCTQIAQCLSIVTACTFYLKPFIDGLESGFIQAGDLRRQHVSGFGYNPESGNKGLRGTKSSYSSSSKRSKPSKKQPQSEDVELQGVSGAYPEGFGHSTIIHSETPDWDANSQSHILHTTAFTVRDGSQEDPVDGRESH